MFSEVVRALPTSPPGYVAGGGVVKLNQNESPYGLAPDDRASLLADLAAVPLNRYPDPGHAAVERLIARREGLGPGMVLAGNGANELLELLIRSTCDPGDEVLTVAPTYHLYDRFCAMNRATLVKVGWGSGFGFPRDAVLRSLGPRTRLVLLCRPNNPTGHLYPAAEVLAVARAFPGIVAVDEAYHDFAGDSVAGWTRSVPNLAVVRTLSKAYGAAGLRFGYMLAPPAVVNGARSLQTPYGVSGLTQTAALFLLSRPGLMERRRDAILTARRDLVHRLEGVEGIEAFASAANFVLVRTAASADALDRHLRARRIVVRNLKWDDRHLRISAGTPADHARLVEAIGTFRDADARP